MKSLGDLMAFGSHRNAPNVKTKELSLEELIARDSEIEAWKSEAVNKEDHVAIIEHSQKLLSIMHKYS